jgi:hypothetical protein
METTLDLEDKSEKEIRKKLRKKSLIFSLIYGFIWFVEWILYVKFNFTFIQTGEPFGLFQVLFFKIVSALWIYKNYRALNVEPFTWVIFCLISPILTTFLIGISKDKESSDEL